MRCLSRIRERGSRRLRPLLLAACATGHDGDINVGGGQSPDPVVLDIPIAYIRGPLPEDLTDLDDLDVRELETFEAGADVWLRDRAAPDVPEHNITERVTNGEWDVRDIDASYDGNKLIFSMRMPLIPGADDNEQPKWDDLGIRPHDRRPAPRDPVRHRRGRRPRRRAALPAGRPHRLLVHAPAHLEGRADRRGQAPVLGPGRRPERARLRPARHECGRQRHPPDLVQPEPRPRPRRPRRRAHRVQPLGERERQLHTFVYGEPGRQRPAAPVRREQPRDRHRRGRARPGRVPARPRCSSCSRARWRTAGCSRS